MLVQSKTLHNKLKFVNNARDLKSDREEEKYVQIMVEDGQVYAKSYSGYSLYRVLLFEDYEQEKDRSFLFDPSKIVKSLSKLDAQVDININWKDMSIAIRNKSARILDRGIEDKRRMPDFVKDTGSWSELEIPETFINCIRRVSWLADKDHIHPACKGVHVRFDPDTNRIAYFATNQHQLALATEPDNAESIEGGGIVPIETVTMLLDVDLAPSAKIHFDETELGFVSGDYGMISSHIQAPEFQYKKIYERVRSQERKTIIIDKLEMISAVEFSLQYCSNNYDQLRLFFGKDFFTTSASSDEGSFFGEHDIRYKGDDMEGQEMIINYKNVIACLKNIDTPSIKIEVYDEERGEVLIFKPNKDELITTEIMVKNPHPYI